MSQKIKRIPKFATEAEERAFWESPKNDSTEYVDWSQATVVPTAAIMSPTEILPYLTVKNSNEIEDNISSLKEYAERTYQWIMSHKDGSLDLLRRMKFETSGFHPVKGHALNIVEQINQTWTYIAALEATRKLIELHPDAEGFKLAPGAHAALELDIMSIKEGLVGAESFAAVSPNNNGKLAADLNKLKNRHETHRYVFFISPNYPGTQRREELDRDGIQVWSVEL